MQAQYIALAWFLILITVGVIVLLSTVIVVKRRVSRRKSRIDRAVYTPCGYGLSKVWKEAVEKRLNSTVRVRTEPRVFGTHYSENFDTYLKDSKSNRTFNYHYYILDKVTFLFRAKAVDEFLELKERILSVCPDLEAPPIRGIHAFLLTARDHAMSPPAPRDRIEEYCKLYLWARHDLNPFGEAEYLKLSQLQSELMKYVSRAAALRDTAASNVASSSCVRRNSTKFHPLNRITPSPKMKSGKGQCRPHSYIDRAKPSSKTNASDTPLKPLSHSRCKSRELMASISDAETPVVKSVKLSHVYSKELDDLEMASMPAVTNVEPSVAVGGSRRGSSQSDGSQTALIDLDPVVQVMSKSSGTFSRHPCANEAFGPVEKKPKPTCVSGPTGDLETSDAGLENQGVNC
ncbi:hypothetical protein P879_00166 [Paragonimus westermani]|uniref:Uncharacterized protein n=1 Tax=Paragonimus westermani TaxID=34504 RepID=A0A8T0DUM0_9TREM|nr:hypothetical protein P879_00166 [Paragonimus westermani]